MKEIAEEDLVITFKKENLLKQNINNFYIERIIHHRDESPSRRVLAEQRYLQQMETQQLLSNWILEIEGPPNPQPVPKATQ